MKKNFLLLWCLLGIAIIVAYANGFQLQPQAAVTLPDSALADALFVCPAESKGFDGAAVELQKLGGPLGVFGMVMLLLWIAISAWTVYISLLKDKFEKKSFELPVFLGKFLFFAFIIWAVLNYSPNYFRRVALRGADGNWVLCQIDSPGARAVKSASVFVPQK